MFFKKEKPKYTYDWVTDMLPVWEQVFKDYKGRENLNYLEVGVFEGRSLIWMFENILTHKGCRATAIDPFYHDTKKAFDTNIKRAGLNRKVDLIYGRSDEYLKTLPNNSYDIIFIDGDHRARGAFLDLAMAWPLLKEGGGF